ncbi:T9SS-dependent choice-of-anchor J family protein [Flavobacterium celericrescens]|uniref:T9SS type A sorting domain-containing protein n=1 Tax=Flavobacterium celericrescens TaxID=2709780 RepID=A0ABX0IDQ4_9FLAO|nr:choice-of-anchor J domain-containing protein [Flavobacterium celericrescens]NHM03822.1 T9SS type A sorting domain-containing protein [Flavobacterium celericrescens]
MKKITLWLFALLTCWQTYSQVGLTENFDASTALPAGWSVSDFSTPTATDACAGNSHRTNRYSFSTSGTLISPNQVAASNGTNLTFSFDYKIENWNSTTATPAGWGNFVVQYSTDNGATWSTFFTVDDSNHVVANTCATFSNVIPGASLPAGSDVRFRFLSTWVAGDYDIYFDNISATQVTALPPNCTALSSPANGAVNIDSSIVSWPAASGVPTGYKLTVGTTPGGTDVFNALDVLNVLTYNLGVLNAGTTYYVKVVPYNANGDAIGCTESSFTTCGTNAVPVLEPFATFLPGCWVEADNGDLVAGPATFGASGWAADGFANVGTTGAINYNVYQAVANDWVISPYYSIPATGYELKYDAAATQYAGTGVPAPAWEADDFVEVLISTGTTNWVVLYTYNAANTNIPSNTGTTNIIDLDAYAGLSVRFAFRVVEGTANGAADIDFSIDNFEIRATPACLEPTGLAVAGITDSSVDLSWIAGGTELDWQYLIQPQGTGTPTGSEPGIVDVTSSNETDSTLSPNTAYEVYVRAFCSVSEQSPWVGPVNFRTACTALTVPFSEGFNSTSSTEACWTVLNVNSDTEAWDMNYTTNPYEGNQSAVMYTDFNAGANDDWLISPTITLTGGQRLKYHYRVQSNFEPNDFELLLSTTGAVPASFTTVLLPTASYSNTTYVEQIVDLSAYSGNVNIAWHVPAGGLDGWRLYIDNVIIENIPVTPPSCASNIVATPNATCGNFSNLITWDATVGADGYYISVGTTPAGTDVANNINLGNVTTYSFTGAIATTYYYTVVPFNANGSATGCAELSFTTAATGCYCTSVPTSVDGSGITNVQLVATNFANTPASYTDHTATPVNMSQGVSNNVQITFATGYTYDTNIWIDFNNDFDFDDAGELVQTGIASTNANPTTLNASFVMPGTAPLGQHRMRIGTADVGQVPPAPCYSGSWGVTLDFTVNIVAASCTPPAATTAVVPACGSGQFSVDVTVTALGNGTPSITDGTTTWPVTALGVVNVGPFASGSSVTLTLLHGVDGTCNVPLGSSTYTCPAANDDLCNAIPVTVNATSTGTAYGNVGATAQTNEPVPGCFSDNINGSVWFTFVAPASGEVNITTDISGATLTDTEIAVYAATGVTCSDLTTLGAALGCDQDSGTTIIYNSFLNLAGLTPGATYYIQVDDYGFGTANGTFGLEVAEVLASDSFDNNSFVAYPNPVKDVFNVSYTSEISSVRVMNLLGQEVLSRDVNATSTQIDMSQLSTGAYIVNVTVGDTIKTIKVVKQ